MRNISIILILMTSFSCTPKKTIEIDYLGQKPPGMTAELFAPGIISTDSLEHSAPAFSPDGSLVLWTVLDKSFRAFMMEMKYEQGKWSAPNRASFSDSMADDYYPSFSADGKKLFFSSRRKVPEGYPKETGIRIWEVERNQNGWGTAVPFDTIVSRGGDFATSVTNSGVIYFSSGITAHTDWSIRQSGKVNGRYTKSTLLPFNINSVSGEDGPFIAPDESFLIFESRRPEGIDGSVDLYISFKNADSHWSIPLNMGPKINSVFGERFARLSPDGKYLFFGSSRSGVTDIYWIDARIIEELRNEATEQGLIENPLGENILAALDSENFESASGLLKQWLTSHPNHLDATLIYSSVLRKLKRYSDADSLLTTKAPEWNENVNFIMERSLVKFGMNKEEEAVNLLAIILTEGPQLRSRYTDLSSVLLEMRKFKTSDEYFEKAMAIHPDRNDYYNRACIYALINEKEKALENLSKALEHGFNAKQHLENDPDLESLKSDPRWKKLLERLR